MKKSKQSLLWKITKEDLSYPSYLFGTMHVRHSKAFQFNDLAEEKIKCCDTFATEFDLAKVDMDALFEAFALPDNKTLHDYISPKKFQKIQRILIKTFGVDLNFFILKKPALITNIISDKILSEEGAIALDQYLHEFATAQEKQIVGIETFEEQLEIMQKMPLDKQIQGLIALARNPTKYRQKVLKTADLYQTGNPQHIYKVAKKGAGDLRKILLYKRNHIMTERIAALVNKQSLFAAIGAGHLAGKQGVLRLLKLQGFTLKPVK